MKRIIAAGLALLAGPACAQEATLRNLCSDRPSLGVSACTVDKGRLQIDLGVGDWELDRRADSRTDTVTLGEVSLRYGLADETELRLGWDMFGLVRERDRTSGAIDRASGIGDVTLGLRQNLHQAPSGRPGLSYGVQPFVTLPAGRRNVGAGDWGAGLIVPVGYRLGDTFTLNLTPEVDAAVDRDGHGRHLAYGNVFGLQTKFSEKLRMTTELAVTRDDDPDPAERATLTRAALSFAYLAQKMTQFDVQTAAGLDRRTPDFQISFGVSHKF